MTGEKRTTPFRTPNLVAEPDVARSPDEGRQWSPSNVLLVTSSGPSIPTPSNPTGGPQRFYRSGRSGPKLECDLRSFLLLAAMASNLLAMVEAPPVLRYVSAFLHLMGPKTALLRWLCKSAPVQRTPPSSVSILPQVPTPRRQRSARSAYVWQSAREKVSLTPLGVVLFIRKLFGEVGLHGPSTHKDELWVEQTPRQTGRWWMAGESFLQTLEPLTNCGGSPEPTRRRWVSHPGFVSKPTIPVVCLCHL